MKLITATGVTFLWIFVCVLVLCITFLLIPNQKDNESLKFLVASSSKNLFNSPETATQNTKNVLAAIKAGDARPVLVDRFLEKYNSPMAGLGETFVEEADKNGLDYRLLPALAFQESNLGRKIPKNSHNPFGWAIYEGQSAGAHFESWEEGISIVSKRMRENYINQGFTTPETIVVRYTSGKDNPRWVFAVRSAMEEISPTTY